jgi:hypothetical protein
MKASKASKSIRRSVALPESLATEAMAVAPGEPKKNFNRVAVLALTEFIAARKREAFAKSMEMMAADREVVSECAVIQAGLKETEMDGLTDGSSR